MAKLGCELDRKPRTSCDELHESEDKSAARGARLRESPGPQRLKSNPVFNPFRSEPSEGSSKVNGDHLDADQSGDLHPSRRLADGGRDPSTGRPNGTPTEPKVAPPAASSDTRTGRGSGPASKLNGTARSSLHVARAKLLSVAVTLCLLRLIGAPLARPRSSANRSADLEGRPPVSLLAEASSANAEIVHVKVGILLEESDHEQANMFIRTIKMINERRDETIGQLLNASAAGLAAAQSKSDGADTGQGLRVQLEPVIEFLGDRHSSFEADTKVCQLIESGARAIVGPVDGASVQHVQSICDNLEIPYFELRSFLGSPAAKGSTSGLHNDGPVGNDTSRPGVASNGPNPSSGSAGEQHVAAASMAPNRLEDLTLNLYPPAHLLNSAYIDLIYAFNWSSFAVVYEDGSSMIKLQDLFRESSGGWINKWKIKLFRYEQQQSSSERPLNRNDLDILERSPNGDSNGANFIAPTVPHNASAAKSQKLLASQLMHSHSSANNIERQPYSSSRNIIDNGDERLFQSDDPYKQHFEQINDRTAPKGPKRRRRPVFRDVLWRVKSSEEKNIILDVKPENLYEALKQAQQVGLMTEEYSYLITSLDLHMVDMEDFKYSRTKITAFSTLQVLKNQDSDSAAAGSSRRFDERYLERLGVHVIPAQNGPQFNARTNTLQINDHEAVKKEMFQSLPASLGLLPTLNRNNEQRLFEFFVEHQEKNQSHVRVSISSAILHDSLMLYLLGLYDLDPTGSLLSERQSIGCFSGSPRWSHGSSLVNYMRRISFTGLTGPISFDPHGLRSDFKLDVVGMAPNIRPIKIGEWHSAASKTSQILKDDNMMQHNAGDGDKMKSYDDLSHHYELKLKHYTKLLDEGHKVQVPYSKVVSKQYGALVVNEIIFERLYREQADQIDTLIVTAKLSQPYFMLKETPNKLEGNDQFEGFAVDLIHELSKLVNFKYKWRVVGDNKYGSKEVHPNGTVIWNGMIGEIVRGIADLAIVDLTITAQREEAVDFTLPFMNTGISILFKKPTTKVTTLFSFLSPFSSDVWAYVLAAYCGISSVLFLVGHLSPYEWADPHPCRHAGEDDEAILKNQFSLLNSFWFTIGSLMQQGSDLTPRSMSTRTIAGIWYFFTLIMISSYTANLAAFLTVEKVVYPIENVRDLSNQDEIRYGCVESGSTCLFFHDSQIDTYKRIDEAMSKFKTYVRSNDEGQKRVGEGKFAFFMESTTIEYIIERNCNLTQIGGLIDSKGYGLATSKKSRLRRPYRTLLNEGILHLQETGMLHVLKNRWWKERRGGGTCTDDGKGGGVTELSLANVGGVFVVLLGGLGISFLVAIAEFMWRARRSGSTRDKMCEEMMNDLKFALACKSSTKPIHRDGRSSRRLRRQQTAESQFDESESQITHPTERGAKDCDPILLHAMITMLMQQQQQQQLQVNNLLQPPIMGFDIGNHVIEQGDIRPRRFGRQQEHVHGQHRWVSDSEAGRRRLLFAQQTIDTADDDYTHEI